MKRNSLKRLLFAASYRTEMAGLRLAANHRAASLPTVIEEQKIRTRLISMR